MLITRAALVRIALQNAAYMGGLLISTEAMGSSGLSLIRLFIIPGASDPRVTGMAPITRRD